MSTKHKQRRYNPCHEKSLPLPVQKQRHGLAGQKLHILSEHHLCFHTKNSTLPLLKSEISRPSLELLSVQATLCQTKLETQKVIFHVPAHIYFSF